MDTVKLLKRAKLCLEKNKWIRGSLAKKANGQTACGVLDREAKCFCVMGALYRASGSLEYENIVDAVDILCVANNTNNLVAFNDHVATSKQQILKLFNKAIELAKKV